MDCWERTFSWDFLQLETVELLRQKQRQNLWNERIDKREIEGEWRGKEKTRGGRARGRGKEKEKR